MKVRGYFAAMPTVADKRGRGQKLRKFANVLNGWSPKQNNTKLVSRAEQQKTEHIYCITPNLRDRFIDVFGEPKLNDVLLTEAPEK